MIEKKLGNDPTGANQIITQTDLIKAAQVIAQLDLDKIGDLTDFIAIPYSLCALTNTILAHLNTAYYHVHGESFVYPNHADSVLLTAGAGAWDLTGAITEVIPAGALSVSAFDLHWMNFSNISGNGELQIDIYKGAALSEVLIGSARTQRNAVFSREGPQAIQIPQQLVNERISCRLSDSSGGALTCYVSFSGHYYA